MMYLDELYVRAVLDDCAREHAALLPGRAFARLQRATPTTTWQRPVVAQRLQQMLTELYGVGQPVGADPALFTRLAWVGIDD